MNFWTFLDRNFEIIFIMFVVLLCFQFGSCGDGKGCRTPAGCSAVQP